MAVPDPNNMDDAQAENSNVADMIHVLAELRPFINAEADIREVAEAQKYVEEDEAERAEVMDRIQEDLRALSQTLSEAKAAALRPSSHPTLTEYESTISHLEDEQLATAKNVNEETLNLARKEAELKRLKEELAELESWDVGREAEKNLDGGVLRLKLFSEAGFSLNRPRDSTKPDQITIRNDTKDDVHVVPIDDSPGNRYHLANKLWALASE